MELNFTVKNMYFFQLLMMLTFAFSSQAFGLLNGNPVDHPSVHSIHLILPAPTSPYDQFLINSGQKKENELKSFGKYLWGFCTGTFISDQHLITAAHCIENIVQTDESKKSSLLQIKDGAFIFLDNPYFNNEKKADHVLVARSNSRIGVGTNRNDIAVIVFPPKTSSTWVQIATLDEMAKIKANEITNLTAFGMNKIPSSDDDRVKKPGSMYSEDDIYRIAAKGIDSKEILIEREGRFKLSHVSAQRIYQFDNIPLLPKKMIISKNIEDKQQPMISYGDSGGALFNKEGKVIAIQSRFLPCNIFPTIKDHGFQFQTGDKLTIISTSDKSKYAICAHYQKIYAEFTSITFNFEIYKMLERVNKDSTLY